MDVLRTLLLCSTLLIGALPAPAGSPEFDADRAWEHLLAQCAFGNRVPGGEGHSRCSDYLDRSLRATGGMTYLHRFRGKPLGAADSIWMTNISARFGSAGRQILLGAHWDTRRWADQEPDSTKHNTPILGANDGASGVAVLLVLAELMGELPPPLPVEIVLFDGEDQGTEGDPESWCLGSREHARRIIPPGPRAVVIVDIVAGKDLLICREAISEEFAGWLNDLLFDTAESMRLFGFENRVCYTIFDDHVPFLQMGIPAVDLVDMHYPQWHTLRDVPDACSKESLEQVGMLLVEFLYGGALR